MRKDKLVTSEIYHVYNKSIAGFEIFRDFSCYTRIMEVIRYYQKENPSCKYSDFIRKPNEEKNNYYIEITSGERQKLVEIIAYCIMPTHVHLVLKQLKDKGISIFMNNILNSYTRYFNVRHKRKGPLWEGRFQDVLIRTEEQLLHLTRYVHLNPVTAYLVNRPEDWIFSSCQEYIGNREKADKICQYEDILEVEINSYKKFIYDRIHYQRELAKIKNLLLD